MISIYDRKDHGYRDLRNPLRGLSMGRLVSLLDAGERGDAAGGGKSGADLQESVEDAVEKDKSARRGGGAVDRDGAKDLTAEARKAIR